MAYSYFDYDGTDTTIQTNISCVSTEHMYAFKVLKEDGYNVTLSDVALAATFTKNNAGVLCKLNTAPSTKIRIIRSTPYDVLMHDFSNGAQFNALSVDEVYEQVLYLCQELVEGKLIIDSSGNFGGTRAGISPKELQAQLAAQYSMGYSVGSTQYLKVTSIDALRQYTGTGVINVLGYYAGKPGIGGGVFVADEADKTTPDNGGTVIVAANGMRWRRQISGERVSLADFGAIPDGSDCGALINRAFEACAGKYLLVAEAGVYMTSVELKAPTGLRFVGAGMYHTEIRATQSLPPISNLLTNKSNNYARRDEYDHSIHIADIAFDADWRGRYSIGTPINNQACGVKFSAVRLSSLINVRVINAALHCFDICADQYIDTGNVTANATNQSEHILLRGCMAENPYRDDAFTTHNSRHITFEDCVAIFDGTVSALGNTQQGFEADEGSSKIVIKNCYAKGFFCGYQSKGHSTTKPAEAVSMINCEADGCAYGAMISVGHNPTGKPGYKPQSAVLRDFVVSNPVGHVNLVNPIALLIYGADGVIVDGITINGAANIVVEQGAGKVQLTNINFKDEVGGGYFGLIELRNTLNSQADIKIDNIHVSVAQKIPAVYKNSSAFRMVLSNAWIAGNSSSGVGVWMRRAKRDWVTGLLCGSPNSIWLEGEGVTLTGDVELKAYGQIFMYGNAALASPPIKAPLGTVMTSNIGEEWVQRSEDINSPNWVQTVN